MYHAKHAQLHIHILYNVKIDVTGMNFQPYD